jgi:hypothetical protein
MNYDRAKDLQISTGLVVETDMYILAAKLVM